MRNEKGQVIAGAVLNPSGRPKGSLNKRTLLQDQIAEAGQDIITKLITLGLDGDVQALRAIADRLLPTIRPTAQAVQFELDKSLSLTEQGQQVLEAVSLGEISPDIGKALIESIGTLCRIAEVDQLQQRLEQLERHLLQKSKQS